MTVVAFNGSPRQGGNTEILLNEVLDPLRGIGVETELIQIGGRAVRGCIGCRKCYEMQNRQCIIDGDPVNEWIAKMIEADVVILGSPTYFADVTAEMKALIDRAGYVCLSNGRPLNRKIGAAAVAVRRGGEIHAIDTIHHFFHIQGMIVPGSTYWSFAMGRGPGEVRDDEEGMRTMRTLGENVAWLLGKLQS